MSEGVIKKFNKGKGYEAIPRELLQSNELSLEAIGLLSNLASYPENWKLYKTELRSRFKKNGKKAIDRIWEELVSEGYLIAFRQRIGKKYDYQYIFTVEKFTLNDYQEIITQSQNEGYLYYHKSFTKVENISACFPEHIQKECEMKGLFWTSQNGKLNLESSKGEPSIYNNKENVYKNKTDISPLVADDDEINNNNSNPVTLIDMLTTNPQLAEPIKLLMANDIDNKIIEQIIYELDQLPQDIDMNLFNNQLSYTLQKAKYEGITDFKQFFVTGLKLRLKNASYQKEDEEKELPKVPLHNWLRS